MRKEAKVHELKCWPPQFEAIRQGAKTFELRKDDRGFAVGDKLRLREWRSESGEYTGREIGADITYKLGESSFGGLVPGYCILAIKAIQYSERDAFLRVSERENTWRPSPSTSATSARARS